MRKANTALERLTHNFPRNRITSPITFTLPIRSMLLMINSVAIEEARQKLFPVIAIYKNHNQTVRKPSVMNSNGNKHNQITIILLPTTSSKITII